MSMVLTSTYTLSHLLLELSNPHVVQSVNDEPTGFLFSCVAQVLVLNLSLVHDLRLLDSNGHLVASQRVVVNSRACRPPK